MEQKIELDVVSSYLRWFRTNKWTIAVHNDYRQAGVSYTFYLFTHPDGFWVKGEGKTDEEALAEAFNMVGEQEKKRDSVTSKEEVQDTSTEDRLRTLLAIAINQLTNANLRLVHPTVTGYELRECVIKENLFKFDTEHRHSLGCPANHYHMKRMPTGPCNCLVSRIKTDEEETRVIGTVEATTQFVEGKDQTLWDNVTQPRKVDVRIQRELYRYFVDASDGELQENGVTREDVLRAAMTSSFQDRNDCNPEDVWNEIKRHKIIKESFSGT